MRMRWKIQQTYTTGVSHRGARVCAIVYHSPARAWERIERNWNMSTGRGQVCCACFVCIRVCVGGVCNRYRRSTVVILVETVGGYGGTQWIIHMDYVYNSVWRRLLVEPCRCSSPCSCAVHVVWWRGNCLACRGLCVQSIPHPLSTGYSHLPESQWKVRGQCVLQGGGDRRRAQWYQCDRLAPRAAASRPFNTGCSSVLRKPAMRDESPGRRVEGLCGAMARC